MILIACRSWRATYVALSKLNYDAANVSLKRHLADPQSIEILARPFAPIETPSRQTKSIFETKTSAINVASSHAPVDIKQIREDTLWLSQQISIDEVSALRIAVLEWQTRPAELLLYGGHEGEPTKSNGVGQAADFRASSFDPGSSLLAKSKNQQKESHQPIEDTGLRRRRLLESYLSERRCILKCNEFLVFIQLSQLSVQSGIDGGQQVNKLSWLRDAGANILASWNINDKVNAKRKPAFLEATEALHARLKNLSNGCGWLQDDDLREEIEAAWARSQILEMIHIMQIMLHILQSAKDLLEPLAILSWFRLMKDYDFFESMQLVSLLNMATIVH